jgi:hypothetical protein
MKTVKEAFEKAYGPSPEGATIHGSFDDPFLGTRIRPVKKIGNEVWVKYGDEWKMRNVRTPVSQPIDNEPASDFLQFFGPEYDKAVSE